MKSLHIDGIRHAARTRPPGYEEELLSRGQVVRGDDGQPVYVVFTDAIFDDLVAKYATADAKQALAAPQLGPGTELKKILAGWPFRIVATPNCSCNARAAEMDSRGCDWCEANIDTIVGWLRKEATKRGLPFLDAAGRLLVKRAIRNARKAAS
jgi:hypothetical protein